MSDEHAVIDVEDERDTDVRKQGTILLYHAMVDLITEIDAGYFRDTGICEALYALTDRYDTTVAVASEIHRQMYNAYRAWPKFSGSVAYPVPAPEGGEEVKDYATSRGWPEPTSKHDLAAAAYCMYDQLPEGLWVGEYGALRRELLEFSIEYLRPKYLVAKESTINKELTDD